MSSYEEFDLPHDLLINCILVENDVRPSMLVQPVDYKEASGSDMKTKSILENIKKWFPSLIQSEKYKGFYQGILISKKSYDNEVISTNQMGQILGYPCYRDFGSVSEDKVKYSIDVNVIFKDGRGTEQIIANVCNDLSQKSVFENIAKEATNVLKMHRIYSSLVDEVVVEVFPIVPTSLVLNKVVRNIKLNADENGKILNIFYNFMFGIELSFFFQDNFQYGNALHRGILIGLLTYEMNEPMKPFYPLFNYPEEDKKISEITNKWEEEIIVLLDSAIANQNIPVDIEETQGILRNIGFSEDFQSYCNHNNKIHQGILQLLRIFGKNNPLEPLTLSGKYPELTKESNQEIKNWENQLLKIIKSGSVGGGKTSKRTTNKKKGINKKRVTIKKKVSNKKGGAGKNFINKCEDTMCTKFVNEAISQKKDFMSIVNETIQTSKKFLNDPDLKKREYAKETLKNFSSMKKEMSAPGYFEKFSKEELQMCKRLYCNPKCPGTSVSKNDLENNFNKDMDPKLMRKLKKDGAISGCIISI